MAGSVAAVLLAAAVVGGCTTPRQTWVQSYYAYDFPAAREAVRPAAERNNEDVVLNNLRLGLASMADGDSVEAEQALRRSFDLLSTAGLNKDRTTAAILLKEDVRIWKGEPFEQALAYYWTSVLYATLGQWDNARAAAANALFRLADFGRDMNARRLAERAARDPEGDYLETGYTAVESDFALGYLMEAIASDLSGASGAREQFAEAVRLEPSLAPIVATLEARRYDTLLFVDFGRGPRKIATGPDNAVAEFRSMETIRGPLHVAANGVEVGAFQAVCDVDRMARDHRWNNLEDVRRAKSAIGQFLMLGGLTAAGVGASQGSAEAAGAGLAAAALGLLLRATAAADTRYLEFAPSSIYVVPLLLEGRCELRLQVARSPAVLVLPDFEPGTVGKPRAVYLRLLGAQSPTPAWLSAIGLLYTNDRTDVRHGDLPWVLGGADVGSPTAARLAAYQRGGALEGWSVRDLERLYASQGIVVGGSRATASTASDAPAEDPRRHILEGGAGLFTPEPDSMGYKRIMYTEVPPYVARAPWPPDLAIPADADLPAFD